jgi:hypothetical protein
MVYRGDFLRQSPRCPVRWGAWRTDTARLQAEGWELAVAYGDYGDNIELSIRHKGMGLYGFSYPTPHPRKTMRDPFYGTGGPEFVMRGITGNPSAMEPVTFNIGSMLGDYNRIDARSRIIEVKSKEDIDRVFAPADIDAEEIITDSATVQDLLDRIRTMQAPEQAAIRQRNARRARDEAEPARCFHASIVSLAA